MSQTELGAYDADEGGSGGERETRNCLSLTVSGPWGHFRHVDGNTIKRTYRVMPRTTVAGLLGAIAGYDRDSYYDLFARGESAIAIEPTSEVRPNKYEHVAEGIQTMNLPENSLTTSGEGLKTVNSRGKVSITYPDPSADRQRVNYEVLVDPEYRIDVWLADNEAYDHLKSMLDAGKSYYAPSLGLSEHLAEIEYHGEETAEPVEVDGTAKIDSAIPDADGVVPDAGVTYGTERSPGYMTQTAGEGEFTGRKTTGFLTYTYSPECDSLRVPNVEPYEIGDRTVVFA